MTKDYKVLNQLNAGGSPVLKYLLEKNTKNFL